MYKVKQLGFSLRRTPPEPRSVEPVPHLLFQKVNRPQRPITTTATVDLLLPLYTLQLLLQLFHRGPGPPLRPTGPLLKQAVPPTRRSLPPTGPDPPPNTRRNLVQPQHQQVHDGAGAAAAHGGALRRRPSGDLANPPPTSRRLLRQQRRRPISRPRRSRHDLPIHRESDFFFFK